MKTQLIATVVRILKYRENAGPEEEAEAIVKAILGVLRQPSEAMRKAAVDDLDFPWWFQDAVAGGGSVTNSAWQRMLDAAIAEFNI